VLQVFARELGPLDGRPARTLDASTSQRRGAWEALRHDRGCRQTPEQAVRWCRRRRRADP
jgi:hypothetical protein